MWWVSSSWSTRAVGLRGRSALAAGALAGLASALSGASGPAAREVAGLTADTRPAPSLEAGLGARVYADQCAVCHGERGDGRGMAAHHFRTAPRDFTKGQYKLRSSASGQLPTDADLRKSIVRGLPGTGMVPQDHLAPAELDAVVEYLKTLSPRFAAGTPPRALELPPATAASPAALERGARMYAKGECAECHGPAGRGDGPSAKDLAIKPSDLTRRPLKSGPTAEDILRTLLAGMDGTPMPSYHLVLDDDELRDLAHWVQSLGGPPALTPDERWGWHVVEMHQGRRPSGGAPHGSPPPGARPPGPSPRQPGPPIGPPPPPTT